MNDLNQDYGKVALLLGGRSSEREVSLSSGKSVLQALKNKEVDVHPIDVGNDIALQLMRGHFDRAFIILHGREGEDGVIQGLLEMLDIPYTGSGVAASALSMDKARSKLIFQRLDLPTLPFMVLESLDIDRILGQFDFPICVKPVHEGSSNGVNRVNERSQFQSAFNNALQYHDQVMVEPWIEGREFTVSVLHGKGLPVVEICVPNGFYTYDAKYGEVDTHYYCPCDLPVASQKELQDIAERAFDALGCTGWCRIDFLQDQKGRFWLTEANTIPGMTTRSLFPMGAKAAGIDFDTLVLQILMTSFD